VVEAGEGKAMRIGAFQVVILYDTGERYALRFEDDGTVTGIYGPLRQGEATASALPNFDYSTELAERFVSENIVGGSARYSYVPLDYEK
jgi:hypothetical protein